MDAFHHLISTAAGALIAAIWEGAVLTAAAAIDLAAGAINKHVAQHQPEYQREHRAGNQDECENQIVHFCRAARRRSEPEFQVARPSRRKARNNQTPTVRTVSTATRRNIFMIASE